MQAPSIQDFPPNSKRRLVQNQHNSQLQLQLQQQQQQQQQQNYDDDMILDNDEPPFKKQRPGVATNFLYKVTELVYYTSAFASEAISTITGSQGGNERQQLTRQIYDDDDDDDVLRVNPDDEEDDSYDQKLDKKDDSAWVENADEEEPPPPYDSSWSMPSPSTTNVKISEMNPLTTTPVLSFSPSQDEFSASQQSPSTLQQITQITTKSTTNTTSRRRQFRVRRGRRLLRRKSSSTDMSNNVNSTSTQPEDDDDIFLKFNCKLADMIAEGKAALTSKVDVTDVEMMIAEEKEREERIMRELGIQTPINRRARRLTSSSSTSSDYDYYSSVLGSGGHSNQSSSSLCDNGFGGGYSVDNGFSTSRPVVGRTSPTQYELPGFNSPTGFYSNGNGNGYGFPSTGSPTTSGFDSGFGRFRSNSGSSGSNGLNGLYSRY